MMQAFGFARRALEKMYDSKADIEVFKEDDSESTSVFAEESTKPSIKYYDQPCRVSQKPIGAATDGNVQYQVKLIISPDLNIPAGSRIKVTDSHGNVDQYVRSGDPFDSYSSHQEIDLMKDDRS